MTPDRRMLHTDAFAWYMEKDPVLRSTVVAVAIIDKPPDWDYLVRRIDKLTRQVPVLRQRVVEPPLRLGPPRWVPDDAFDLGYHLRRVRLPEPGDWAAVLQAARVAAMADFDRARPLWEFTLLEGLPEGRAAFITKSHHAVADGIGGLEIAALLVDLTPEMPEIEEMPDMIAPARPGALGIAARSLIDDLAEFAATGVRAGRATLPATLQTLRHPRSGIGGAAATVVSIGRIVRPILHNASPVLIDRRMSRHLDTLDVPLASLQDAAHAAGGHVNDAFVAGVTGGLRRYHDRHGVTVDELRMTMPISVRRPNDPIGGNRITLLRFAVPVAIVDPGERIRAIAATVSRWRAERAIPLTQGIAFGLNLAPRSVIQGILRRVDFLASDVPGLTAPVYLAGSRIEAYYPFGPTIGSAVNATLMTYVDNCCIGVNVDVAAIPDVEELMADLRAGFDEVIGLAARRKQHATAG
ncbi:MAG TPA: wax ester/triacylglycerol synthase domain-containing protein [Mycobacteriales bacterium]|jgi:diacylglycerol O-acyltransferase|nr:wax ester/triacylglycerol synthase domain-containing protein [Mycobacteriales bacterium]